jgi:hypothetical protein
MMTVRKDYFCVISLIVIGSIAGRAAGQLVESTYLAGYDPTQATGHGPVMAPQRALHAKDGATITKRDIFCSGCASVRPSAEPSDVPDKRAGGIGRACAGALATSARFVPSMKDGKLNGYTVYVIRPHSLLDRIGLRNGDTIKTINGSDMTTADAALRLYSSLRNASYLAVTVDRRGKTIPLGYSMTRARLRRRAGDLANCPVPR